jgi:glutamyl-tRNA synthetase
MCKNEKEEDSEEKSPRNICDCRNNSIKDNQEKWKKMLDKKGFKEGEAVLRFKSSDTTVSNPALIDFPLARINEHVHPRQGKKYRVWPLMNLCVTLDDMEFKSTHIIRGKEHADNALRQEMIFQVYKKPMPKTYFLGRYKFDDLPLSKSKFQEMIKEGEYSGWDDVRLPLARNFRKRGYQPEAFAKMATKRGLSAVDKVIGQHDYFMELDGFNREVIKNMSTKASFEIQNKKSKDSVEILIPNGKTIYGRTDLKDSKLKEGNIIYFAGIGYCRYNPKEKVKFWFAHR